VKRGFAGVKIFAGVIGEVLLKSTTSLCS